MPDPFDDPAWRDSELRWLEEPTECAFCYRPFDECRCSRGEAADFAITAPATAPRWLAHLVAVLGFIVIPAIIVTVSILMGWAHA
jgi:hypothetical protein